MIEKFTILTCVLYNILLRCKEERFVLWSCVNMAPGTLTGNIGTLIILQAPLVKHSHFIVFAQDSLHIAFFFTFDIDTVIIY